MKPRELPIGLRRQQSNIADSASRHWRYGRLFLVGGGVHVIGDAGGGRGRYLQ